MRADLDIAVVANLIAQKVLHRQKRCLVLVGGLALDLEDRDIAVLNP
ncbi:hypothetical protein [Nioella sp.]